MRPDIQMDDKTSEQSVDLFEGGFQSKAKFEGPSTLESDLEDLLRKWKGTKAEVYVHHMIDSLILFKHNLEQYNSWWGFNLRATEKDNILNGFIPCNQSL